VVQTGLTPIVAQSMCLAGASRDWEEQCRRFESERLERFASILLPFACPKRNNSDDADGSFGSRLHAVGVIFQSILTLMDLPVPLRQLSLTESQDPLPSDLDLDPIVLNHALHEWRIQTTSRKEMRSVMAGSKGRVSCD